MAPHARLSVGRTCKESSSVVQRPARIATVWLYRLGFDSAWRGAASGGRGEWGMLACQTAPGEV